MSKRVLILANHRPNRSPGQRFRFEQYVPYLRACGFECDVSPLISTERQDRVLYGRGHHLGKALLFLNGVRRRTADWCRRDRYDIVFVYREALMTGHTLFERLFRRTDARMIFDFDDAIWLPTVSSGNRTLAWLKNPAKTDELLHMADMIFAGNRYLAEYASQFSDCVRIVPTTVDTDVFRPEARRPCGDGVVEIGWTGSPTTIEHFVYLVPTLVRLREKYGDRVRFKVIGDEAFRDDRLGLRGIPWRRETELDDLSTMDIGIMPLPDSPWTRGKCGFKGLTYMSLGIPAVMSPVGVNTEIVDDGMNGFLADSNDEWIDTLSRLIEQPELRAAVGIRGRATVVARYSVASQKDRYVQLFREVLDRHSRTTA